MISTARYRELAFELAFAPRTPIEQLECVLRTRGPIRCVRVSQAPVGAARYGPYYGVVPYEVRLTAQGKPCAYALGAARREYRSRRPAEDAADRSGKPVLLAGPGILSSVACARLLDAIGGAL